MSRSKKKKQEQDIKSLLDAQLTENQIPEKEFKDVKGEQVKGEDCEETEIINFEDAKPDPDIRKTKYDRAKAQFLIDVFDRQFKLGDLFKANSTGVFEQYSKSGEINLDEKDCPKLQGNDKEPTCLKQFMKDFGLLNSMNPTTLLKIYAGDDESLDQYEFNYLCIKKYSEQAANPSDQLPIFKDVMKKLKTIYTYFDCDGSGRVSANEMKKGLEQLEMKLSCKDADGESEHDFQPNSIVVNQFVMNGMYKSTHELRPEDFDQLVMGALNERYFKDRDEGKDEAVQKSIEMRGCLVKNGQGPVDKKKIF